MSNSGACDAGIRPGKRNERDSEARLCGAEVERSEATVTEAQVIEPQQRKSDNDVGLVHDDPTQTGPVSPGLPAAGEGANGPHQPSVWEGTGARPKGRRETPKPVTEMVRSSEAAFCSNGVEVGEEPPGQGRSERETGSQDCSHHTCPECGRAFTKKVGLSLHRRKAHYEEYNRAIDVTRSRPRWTEEEEYLMARLEADLTLTGAKRNINELLANRLNERSFDSIKSHRKSPRYKELVVKLRSRLASGGGDCGAPETIAGCTPPPSQPTVNQTREAIEEELRALVAKPPPTEYDGSRLWEIVQRYLGGETSRSGLSTAINSYVREALQKDHQKKGRSRPRPPKKPESRRKAKKRLYAQTQERFKRKQGKCAREILDGEVTAAVENPQVFLEEWRSVMESVPTGTVSDVVEHERLQRGRNGETTCRAKCQSIENMGHILQKCKRTHYERIRRHNVIAKYLAKRLREGVRSVGGASLLDCVRNQEA
ncbi:hypothetical protein V5799_011458 [Amblyomma americanum]|uniref:C2H2-type domain-containing protein n=1 Tax=Amblyomma americanum TaxID=6943 RepID=A0AAQ4EGU2_AMBAM